MTWQKKYRIPHMDFSTASFWYSLLPAILVLAVGDYLLRSRPAAKQLFHKWLMLGLSLILLGIANETTLVIFLTVTLAAYYLCRWGCSLSMTARRWLLGFLIPLLLLPLGYYKYGYFFGNILQQEWDTLRNLIIPIGISFYTFQVIGFCIDTLMRSEPMPKWLDYMNFCAYFPQIVAGPIERRADLLPQVQKMELNCTRKNLEQGIPYIILGLFFKLALADNLAYAMWDGYKWGNAWIVWINNLLFTFRIYFDFGGYGLTAYGIARCMGITLRMNFMSPYTACNIKDFWRRWHTSLTQWFTDYIYFSLGGSRTKRWAVNMILVFLISGLWHGAGWNFIIWGGLAGVALVVHRVFHNAGLRLWAPLGWLLTFGYMVFVWMFFYDSNPAHLWNHLNWICSPVHYSAHELMINLLYISNISVSIFIPFTIMLSGIVIAIEAYAWKKLNNPYKILLHPISCGIMVALILLLHNPTPNQFIYFAF